jgi:hypothetical protein
MVLSVNRFPSCASTVLQLPAPRTLTAFPSHSIRSHRNILLLHTKQSLLHASYFGICAGSPRSSRCSGFGKRRPCMCVMTTTSSPQLTLSRGRGVLASQESTTPDASALIESESAEAGTGAARMIYLLNPPRRYTPFNGTQPMIPGSRWVLTFQTPPQWHPHLPTPYRSMAKIIINRHIYMQILHRYCTKKVPLLREPACIH